LKGAQHKWHKSPAAHGGRLIQRSLLPLALAAPPENLTHLHQVLPLKGSLERFLDDLVTGFTDLAITRRANTVAVSAIAGYLALGAFALTCGLISAKAARFYF
jgi:hypothetical protein